MDVLLLGVDWRWQPSTQERHRLPNTELLQQEGGGRRRCCHLSHGVCDPQLGTRNQTLPVLLVPWRVTHISAARTSLWAFALLDWLGWVARDDVTSSFLPRSSEECPCCVVLGRERVASLLLFLFHQQ